MHIDDEIRDLERRMAWRRHEVANAARAVKARAVRRVISPVGLATAAGIGFIATWAFLRRPRVKVIERRKKERSGGKLAGLAGLAMPVALALVRERFGGPQELAHLVLSKVQKKKPTPVV
jgi:hypothetical protein